MIVNMDKRNIRLVPLDDDYYDIKLVDRKLSQEYVGPNTLFSDIGGAGGTDSLNWLMAGAKGCCVDINLGALKKGKDLAKRHGVYDRISFIKASATNLPLIDNTFDLVTSFSVIDHIPPKTQAQKAISEFSRIAAPRGHVVVTVPNKLFLLGTVMVKAKMLTQKDSFFEQRFTPKEMSKYCAESNLQIIRYDSKYPLVVGRTVLTHNAPKFLQKMPTKILWSLIRLIEKLFAVMEERKILLLGARYGIDAVKI